MLQPARNPKDTPEQRLAAARQQNDTYPIDLNLVHQIRSLSGYRNFMLGDIIVAWRHERGMNSVDLAVATRGHVSKNRLSQIEYNRVTLLDELTLLTLANALAIPGYYLEYKILPEEPVLEPRHENPYHYDGKYQSLRDYLWEDLGNFLGLRSVRPIYWCRICHIPYMHCPHANESGW